MLSLVTAPAAEPLSVDDVKQNHYITVSDDDELIENLIAEAREYVERSVWGGVSLLTQTWDWFLPEFPCGAESLFLPRPPLQTLKHVKYYNGQNTLTTLYESTGTTSSLMVLTPQRAPGMITPAVDTQWPATICRPDAVQIRFDSGYASAAAVPRLYKRAINLLVGHWYFHREATLVGGEAKPVPHGVEALIGLSRY